MFDLGLVEALYNLQHDPTATPEEREEAKRKITGIADAVVEEYLSTLLCEEGNRKGSRKFDTYEVLYGRNCIEGPVIVEGAAETNPPPEDRIGNVLFHRQYSRRSE